MEWPLLPTLCQAGPMGLCQKDHTWRSLKTCKQHPVVSHVTIRLPGEPIPIFRTIGRFIFLKLEDSWNLWGNGPFYLVAAEEAPCVRHQSAASPFLRHAQNKLLYEAFQVRLVVCFCCERIHFSSPCKLGTLVIYFKNGFISYSRGGGQPLDFNSCFMTQKLSVFLGINCGKNHSAATVGGRQILGFTVSLQKPALRV